MLISDSFQAEFYAIVLNMKKSQGENLEMFFCVQNMLFRIIAESDLCLRFVDDILMSKFEIGADALCTFRDLITKHKELMAQILSQRYEQV